MRDWLVSTLRADFEVTLDPYDRLSVLVFRLNQAAHRSRARAVVGPVAAALDMLWLRMVNGAELPWQVECGPGLRLAHGGRGVILNPDVRIGSDATIYPRVTLGVNGAVGNVPTLGDHVYLGMGATVIGRVILGDKARVGAGAVVTHDVPAGATAVGVPARPR